MESAFGFHLARVRHPACLTRFAVKLTARGFVEPPKQILTIWVLTYISPNCLILSIRRGRGGSIKRLPTETACRGSHQSVRMLKSAWSVVTKRCTSEATSETRTT